jgi:hypothetical protein
VGRIDGDRVDLRLGPRRTGDEPEPRVPDEHLAVPRRQVRVSGLQLLAERALAPRVVAGEQLPLQLGAARRVRLAQLVDLH